MSEGGNAEEAVKAIENGLFTYAAHTNESGTTFGLYHKLTPHAIPFSKAQDVAAQNLELLAAGYFANGVFSFSTGQGVVHFKGNEVVNGNAAPNGGDCLLGSVAPLAFLGN